MGEAKRRKLTESANPAPPKPLPLPGSELAMLGKALGRVVGSITGFHGADCLMYAGVGAMVLRAMGYPSAKMVLGSAAWRVGPGAGDVISHAREINEGMTVYAPPSTSSGTAKAGMFHAWIDVDGAIVDFTTASLSDKAAQLDAADGGKTQVAWAPTVLWADRPNAKEFKDVVNSYDSGVYAYRRHERLELEIVSEHVDEFDFEAPAAAVMTTLNALKAGREMKVFGVGDGELQTLDSARQFSTTNVRKPA